jgi:hypothetical protein
MEFLVRSKVKEEEVLEGVTRVDEESQEQLTSLPLQHQTVIDSPMNSTEIPPLGISGLIPLSLDDENSPRTNNLMFQFSQVLSAVGDDDDEMDFPRREDLFTPPNNETIEPLMTENVETKTNEQIQIDAIDFDIWEDQYIPPPPISSLTPPTLVENFYQLDETNSLNIPPPQTRSNLFETLPNYKENFTLESRPVELVVSKIPEDLVRARQQEIEISEAKVREHLISTAKTRERDLLWREHQARSRVTSMETEARLKLENERMKIYETKREKEELLARQFRRAKEDMESFLSKQEAHLQEVHGEVIQDQVRSSFAHCPFPFLTPFPL